MAKQITRTFIGYNVNLITVDENGNTKNSTVYVAGGNEETAKKAVARKYAGQAIITGVTKCEELRGMDIDKFYELSEPCTRPLSQQKKSLEE